MSDYANSHPISVRIADQKVTVTLADGREISNPLDDAVGESLRIPSFCSPRPLWERGWG